MDTSSEKDAFDVPNCSKMSVEQKREFIDELFEESNVASQLLLQSWSRQEILEILCTELGKTRKYTGLTKVKIIERLLKTVSEKRSGDFETSTEEPNPRNCKRQRKSDNPSRFPVNSVTCSGDRTIYCNNTACRAVLRQEDKFCRRCSCCICHLFDDNKDPSVWLSCSSEIPSVDNFCGLSCHLDCAFKHEKSGLGIGTQKTVLDGCFCCVSCGTVNDLLGCCKKQLIVAKDARRVDILCYRLSLARKLLKGTKKYQNIFDIVDEAVKKLEAEVGPLSGSPVKMARGIVNRLPCGPEVQKLCSSALKSLESSISCTIPEVKSISSKIRFIDTRASSLTVVLGLDESSDGRILHYRLWHRKVTDKDYPDRSTCTLFTPNIRFVLSGLTPATEYCFKVITFSGTIELSTDEIRIWTGKAEDEAVERSESPATNCSSLSNPSSVEDELNNYVFDRKQTQKKIVSQNLSNVASSLNEEKVAKTAGVEHGCDVQEIEKNQFLENQIIQETVPGNGLDSPVQNNGSKAGLPATPARPDKIMNDQSKTEKPNDNPGKNIENGVNSKKNGGNRVQKVDSAENGVSDRDFEGCVKVIRQLECLGHIEKSFRQNFLTWYSLRATGRDNKVVKVFIDTFSDDPKALAEQLADTFSDSISCKPLTAAAGPPGLCLKLWH